jgi:hypothetical protein
MRIRRKFHTPSARAYVPTLFATANNFPYSFSQWNSSPDRDSTTLLYLKRVYLRQSDLFDWLQNFSSFSFLPFSPFLRFSSSTPRTDSMLTTPPVHRRIALDNGVQSDDRLIWILSTYLQLIRQCLQLLPDHNNHNGLALHG